MRWKKALLYVGVFGCGLWLAPLSRWLFGSGIKGIAGGLAGSLLWAVIWTRLELMMTRRHDLAEWPKYIDVRLPHERTETDPETEEV